MKIDIKYALWFVVLVAASCFSYCYWSEIKHVITDMFACEWIAYLLVGLSAIITILHKIKFRKFTFSENMSFAQFKIPFEDIFSFISNPITIVCSYSLARGLFLQFTGQEIYFPHLSGTEMTFIAIVIGYLLYLSLGELTKNFWQLMTKQLEVVTPHPSDEQGRELPHDPDHHKKTKEK